VDYQHHRLALCCMDLGGKRVITEHWRNWCHGLYRVAKSTIFWDITPYSPLSTDVSEVHIASIFMVENISSARNQRECRWQACWTYFSTLKMEAICSSEMSGDTQRTTWRYIPEDYTLHNHRCENLESYILSRGCGDYIRRVLDWQLDLLDHTVTQPVYSVLHFTTHNNWQWVSSVPLKTPAPTLQPPLQPTLMASLAITH
jgi:hypothetical protein